MPTGHSSRQGHIAADNGRSSSVLAQIRIVRPRVAPAISRAGLTVRPRREAPVSAAKRVRSRHKRPAHEANAGPGFALRRPSGVGSAGLRAWQMLIPKCKVPTNPPISTRVPSDNDTGARAGLSPTQNTGRIVGEFTDAIEGTNDRVKQADRHRPKFIRSVSRDTAKRSYNPDFRSSSFSRHGAPPKKAH